MDAVDLGHRIRRLRFAQELSQIEFAERVGVASGSVSKLENGRMPTSSSLLGKISGVLDCSSDFLVSAPVPNSIGQPWLRAYADASQRAVDRQVAECVTAAEVVRILNLRRLPDEIPTFMGNLDDDEEIDRFAEDVRAAARIENGQVVGNAIRAAERLGCIVLPMREELGRHLGMSLRIDADAFIGVSRPSLDPNRHVPGDRQRFTVAHEVGHLALHSGLRSPENPEDAGRIERQANLFAAAFLAPGDAMLAEIDALGNRVTLGNLAKIKAKWGIAVKALVTRFRQLGVIDADAARSLYKQISARGWNRSEPVEVGNEKAVWLAQALERRTGTASSSLKIAATNSGLGLAYFERWTDWTPTASGQEADVIDIGSRRRLPSRT